MIQPGDTVRYPTLHLTSTRTVAHDRFGDHVTAARSQPYYLDVTHPDANKGAVAQCLSAA